MEDYSIESPKLDTKSSQLSGKIMLFSIVTLMIILIMIFAFNIYTHLVFRYTRRNAAGNRRQVAVSGTNRRGLSPLEIDLIPMFRYSSVAAAGQTLECVVCLSEFEEGEKGRVLPGCRHSFHVECVDTWLRSYSSCPICRVSVRPERVRDVECGCSTAAVRMVLVECRRKSVEVVLEPILRIGSVTPV